MDRIYAPNVHSETIGSTSTGSFDFDFVFSFAGITNRSTSPIKLYFSKYDSNSYVVVQPNTYREIPVSSDYCRYEFLDAVYTGDAVLEFYYFSSQNFLVPRFPNLYIEDPNNPGNYFLYNPINTDGFFTETYNFGESTYKPYNSESIVEIDYWFNGQKLPASDLDFYNKFFKNFIETYIQSVFPFSETNEVLYMIGGQTSEIILRTKEFFEQIDRPLNDEYVGGWAKLTTYDRRLSLLTFDLDSGDKIEFPFSVIGVSVTALDPSSSFSRYLDSTLVDANTLTNVGDTYTDFGEEFNRIIVNSGRVRVQFSGNLVKLTEFAPIVNIYYPLGFDETSGQPADAYTTFLNELSAFENHLSNVRFTGRVIKYKWVTHRAQDHVVWNADYYNIKVIPPDFKLPYVGVQQYLTNFYVYNTFEDRLIDLIYEENSSVLVSRPNSLEEIINNNSVVLILGVDFSSYPPATRVQEKRKFLEKFLFDEYLGSYSKGGGLF